MREGQIEKSTTKLLATSQCFLVCTFKPVNTGKQRALKHKFNEIMKRKTFICTSESTVNVVVKHRTNTGANHSEVISKSQLP